MAINLSGIQQANEMFSIAAFDQRGSLAKILKLDPKKDREKIIQLKHAFMEQFSPHCSAVLTDPEFGLTTLDAKDSNAGLLLSLEKSSYEAVNPDDLPDFYPDWGVSQIIEHGGKVKMLVFYHPESVNTDKKMALIRTLREQSNASGSLFLLEPLLHPLNGQEPSWDHYLRMIKGFADKADVLKLPFPQMANEFLSREELRARCERITQEARVPWILLSRGVDFNHFVPQLEIALEGGAKGFAAGRAIWKEVGDYTTFADQKEFLASTAVTRLKQLVAMVS